MLSFIIDILQSRQCVAQLLVHMQTSLFYEVVYINFYVCVLVNLFYGYSHLANRVVFACNMFPRYVIGLDPRYCYGYKLFGVAIWQDKRYNDIQACNLRFLLVIMIASVWYWVFSYSLGLSLGKDIAMWCKHSIRPNNNVLIHVQNYYVV